MYTFFSEVYDMENRLKLVRKACNLTQEMVSSDLGISQQTLSRCENNIETLQIDLLYKMSDYYNVSTDYLLGISNIKKNIEQVEELNKKIFEYQDFIEVFDTLQECDKQLVINLVFDMKKVRAEEK